ncbi:MAG: hypothetical protein ABFS12_05325 [Bacteroidota bacterium]
MKYYSFLVLLEVKKIKFILDKQRWIKYITSMKKYAHKIILLFFSFSLLFAGTFYNDFIIVSDSDNVMLSWQTTTEDNLKETCIERKTVNGIFSEIGIVKAKGDNSFYEFIDENAFKTNDAVYIYRLKFAYNDNRTPGYSAELSVTHLTSVGKQTWGSIKALFR